MTSAQVWIIIVNIVAVALKETSAQNENFQVIPAMDVLCCFPACIGFKRFSGQCTLLHWMLTVPAKP